MLPGSYLPLLSQRPSFMPRDVQKHCDSVSSLSLHPLAYSRIHFSAFPKPPHKVMVPVSHTPLPHSCRSNCTVMGSAPCVRILCHGEPAQQHAWVLWEGTRRASSSAAQLLGRRMHCATLQTSGTGGDQLGLGRARRGQSKPEAIDKHLIHSL